MSFTASEIAILESLSHGGKEMKALLTPSELSMIAGQTLDNAAIPSAYHFLRAEKYIVNDAMSGKVILTPEGKRALEKADQQRMIRQNFQLLEGQLKAANDLSESLIKELHDQAERSDKQRKEAEKKKDKEKWLDRLFSFILGVLTSVTAACLMSLIG